MCHITLWNMNRYCIISALIILCINQGYSQIVEIPDTAFLYALIEEGVDTNGDNLLSQSEAEPVTELYMEADQIQWGFDHGNITSLSGIEWFINLSTLELL